MTLGLGAPLEDSFTSEDSPSESARFDLCVRRYVLERGDGRDLGRAIVADAPDLAIVRVSTERPELISRFHRICDDVVVADCLVCHSWFADGNTVPTIGNPGFETRLAGPADRALVNELTTAVFAGYRNHYAANPLLHGFDLTAGYREWVESYLQGEGRECRIVVLDGTVCGFVTLRIAAGVGEVVLGGVLPAFQGKGVYRDFLRDGVRSLAARGAKRIDFSTQVDNRAVQRVWAREGYVPTRSCFTVHLNLLGRLKRDPGRSLASRRFTVTEDVINRYADFSGDVNPVHMDDAAARASGFPGRILHGPAVAGYIGALLGTVWPGRGTVLRDLRLRYRAPLIVGREYSVGIFHPRRDVDVTSAATVHAAVHDAETSALNVDGVATVQRRPEALSPAGR